MSGKSNKKFKNTLGDCIHAGTKAAISGIASPWGNIASEFFDLMISKPLDKRKDAWLQDLSDSLIKLQEQVEGLELENLIEDELFQIIILDATNVAIKTHQKLKRQALLNACLNCAKRINISEDKQLIFIKAIDQLTDMDIKLLKFLYKPDNFLENIDENSTKIRDTNRGFDEIINIFPEFTGEESLVVSRMNNLIGLGMMKDSSKQIANRSLGDIYDLMTDLGREFMEYISKEEN